MARIRTIKPSFFKNEELADLSVSTRLLFVGLWCLADKEGRLEDRPKRIKAELFPYDSIEIDEHLSRLQSAGFINRYGFGELKVIQIINFSKHQRITGSEAQSESELPAYGSEETPRKQHGNTLDDKEGKGLIGKEGKGDTPDPLEENKINIPFEDFWKAYEKKVGEKLKLQKKWEKLKDDERQKIMDYIPLYKASTPDKTYRKNPETFFNKRSWEDEIIDSNSLKNGNGKKTGQNHAHRPVITGAATGAGTIR